MNTVKVKTSELTGAALDWAVAKAVGLLTGESGGVYTMFTLPDEQGHRPVWIDSEEIYSPSTDWSQLGPLMEKYLSELTNDDGCWVVTCFTGFADNIHYGFGRDFDSKLVAVCRAIVDAVSGDEVEVPRELLGVAYGM
jgi:Protein of unknown function (DUF2591)